MANCIKLKPLGLDERNVLLIFFFLILFTMFMFTMFINLLILITCNINTTAVTTIIAMPRDIKVKFSMYLEGEAN